MPIPKIEHIASSSSGNAHVINDTMLLDAGLMIKELRKHVDLREIEFALLSHEHGDHSKSIPDLLRSAIPVYTSRGSAKALGILSHHRVHTVEAGERFRVGAYTVTALEAVHDAEEPLGFLIVHRASEVLYLTDTAFSKYRFEGLTHILIECNYSNSIALNNVEDGLIPETQRKRLVKTHFGLEDVLEFLESSDLGSVQEIHLLHLSDRNSNALQFKKKIQSMTGIPVVIAQKRRSTHG